MNFIAMPVKFVHEEMEEGATIRTTLQSRSYTYKDTWVWMWWRKGKEHRWIVHPCCLHCDGHDSSREAWEHRLVYLIP